MIKKYQKNQHKVNKYKLGKGLIIISNVIITIFIYNIVGYIPVNFTNIINNAKYSNNVYRIPKIIIIFSIIIPPSPS